MQIVIEVDEKRYEEIKRIANAQFELTDKTEAQIIANGILLPEGHGRLIDETKITKCEKIGLIVKDGNVTRCLATDAPTIVEADK